MISESEMERLAVLMHKESHAAVGYHDRSWQDEREDVKAIYRNNVEIIMREQQAMGYTLTKRKDTAA